MFRHRHLISIFSNTAGVGLVLGCKWIMGISLLAYQRANAITTSLVGKWTPGYTMTDIKDLTLVSSGPLLTVSGH